MGPGFKDPATFVKKLAIKESKPVAAYLLTAFIFITAGCVVVLTGPIDYISDGISVIALENGNDFLGLITGSGCILGSCIASYCAVASDIASEDPSKVDGDMCQGDMFVAAITG